MSKESELNALIKVMNDKLATYNESDPGDISSHEGLRDEFNSAANDIRLFKRDNMAQILKDRKAK